MMENLWNKFRESSLRFGGRIAVQYKQDGRWMDFSFDDLRRNIEALSAFLSEVNIKKGDVVAVSMENRPEIPAIFFALFSKGAIVVPINPVFSPQEVRNVLSGSGCGIIFVSGDSFLLKKGTADDFSFIKKVISVETDEFRKALKNVSSDTVGGDSDIKEDHTACILYTSGTTAEPKGVMLSHRNLLANSDSLFRLGLMRQNDGIMAVLPLYDAYPITVTMMLPLLYGGRIIYPGSICPEEVITAMQEKNPAGFIGVPQIFHMFHGQIAKKVDSIPLFFRPFFKGIVEFLYGMRKITGINLSRHLFRKAHRQLGRSMRVFICGGAKLDENAGEDLFRFGFTILEGYGLTEASPVLTMNPVKKPKIGSVGLPLPDVELKLVDTDGEGAGEIAARGPNIMKGYHGKNGLTCTVMKDGWFHTGDIGFIDRDGYLFLKGRAKDVIIFDSGLNVYPGEIEDEYSKEAPVKEICVFEVYPRQSRESQFLKAAVVPDPVFSREHGGDLQLIRKVLEEKFDKVSQKLSSYKRINDFFVTFEELPRTRMGKIKRYEVKAMYAGQGMV